MPDFIDKVKINIKSGKGGDGHVSFRREKYVANGGPDGGDGGRGGDVIFVVDEGLNTLADFHYNGKYKAENGEDGKGKRCTGAAGRDLIIKVPEGTLIREAESGKIIADMSLNNRRVIVLKGGRGGSGNMHYATSTMQVPKYAKPGMPALELTVILELKMIADVGLIGLPNVGKSTFLTKVSAARPKVANYHFTTLTPSLGVVSLDDAPGFVVADIPGLIEGAADGVGLGHDFLRHVDRTRVLIHVVDASGCEGRDPLADIKMINSELAQYNPELAQKRQIIAANKIDLLPEGENADIIKEIRAEYNPLQVEVFPVSTLTGQGMKELLYAVSGLLKEIGQEPEVYEQEYDPDTMLEEAADPYTLAYDAKKHEYVVEGPLIDKMLGYTNIESEKGFVFFQKFLKDQGILNALRKMGIHDGDTVRMYGNAFEFMDEEAGNIPDEAFDDATFDENGFDVTDYDTDHIDTDELGNEDSSD